MNVDYKIDGFNSISISGLYDLDQYGRLASIEYIRNIVEGFDFKLGITKIIGNDNENIKKAGIIR